MRCLFLFFSVFLIISLSDSKSQTIQNSEIKEKDSELKGLVLDMGQQTALPYANIYVLHKDVGVISNELGEYSIDISKLDKTDTLRFQYIGYKTKNLTIGYLIDSSTVYLKEDIINLSETLIFGDAPDPKSIVEKILKNKDVNYKRGANKEQTFIRERYMSDLDDLKLNLKKNSFSELSDEFIGKFEKSIPKKSISYTDFLGYIYYSGNADDSVILKVDPVRTVALKDKTIGEVDQMISVFDNMFRDTQEKEYWKVKSGVFGHKIDVDDSERSEDDTLKDNERRLSFFSRRQEYNLHFRLMDDKDDWEFLYKTGKYDYSLAGGTKVNGEEVYIIDFKPKSGGVYTGRIYVSLENYALIKADYEYARGKSGTDFHLLGVGYTENVFKGSIYFEKKEDKYILKYLSRKIGSYVSFNRNVVLLKKRKRFLFDKTLNEIKVGVNLTVKSEQSIEVLVLNDKEISEKQFSGFKQKDKMEIIYVDQFDDNLWKGFSIIEPIEQMREYKKQEQN